MYRQKESWKGLLIRSLSSHIGRSWADPKVIVRSQESPLSLPCRYRDLRLSPMFCCFPRPQEGLWIGGGAVRTQTDTIWDANTFRWWIKWGFLPPLKDYTFSFSVIWIVYQWLHNNNCVECIIANTGILYWNPMFSHKWTQSLHIQYLTWVNC